MVYFWKFINSFFLGRNQLAFWAQVLTFLFFLWVGWAVWQSVGKTVTSSGKFIIHRDNIFVQDPPAWLSDQFISQVFDLSRLSEKPLCSLDPEITEAFAAAFAAHPSVERVVKVQLEYPTKLWVKLVFRTPVALVFQKKENEDIVYPIDFSGRTLPDEYFNKHPEIWGQYIRIQGILSSVPLSPGLWNDIQVRETAWLADFLMKQAPDLRVYLIQAPKLTDSNIIGAGICQYVFKTEDGKTIRWGTCKVPVYKGLDDPAYEQQMQLLKENMGIRLQKLRHMVQTGTDQENTDYDVSAF